MAHAAAAITRGVDRPAVQGARRSMAAAGDSLASSFTTSYVGVIAFMAVVSEGNFARAGHRLGIGRSAISRSVQKLETQLDVRLFSRTTRSTSLTAEGERFHAHCQPGVEHIVQALEDMQGMREGPPHGHLRVHATPSFGRKVVAPLLKGFAEAFPDVSVDLFLSEDAMDFTSDRIDVAFRNGRLEDSQIVAKRLLPMQTLVCASPDYAERHGLPTCIADLIAHRCINFRLGSGRIAEWEFSVDGAALKTTPRAALTFNDAELVLQAVLGGDGIAPLADYQVGDLLRCGRLMICLADYAPDDSGHYICYLNRQQMPARTRAFIDHMTAHMRALELMCPGQAVMA